MNKEHYELACGYVEQKKLEIADHLAQCRTNYQIAEAAGISKNTVKTNHKIIVKKVQAENRTQSVLCFVRFVITSLK